MCKAAKHVQDSHILLLFVLCTEAFHSASHQHMNTLDQQTFLNNLSWAASSQNDNVTMT